MKVLRRIIAVILALLVLAGSASGDRPVRAGEKKVYRELTVCSQATKLPDDLSRLVKPIASLWEEGLTVDHPLRFSLAITWHPAQGSLLVSRFLRDAFYNTVSINAP